MIKTVPFIETIGTQKFKEFLNSPFSFEQLYSFNGQTIMFDGWRGKNMNSWFKYTNDDNFILEVYAETYNLKTKNKSYVLPHPKTINDFINDMMRFDIQLYWNEWIDDNFEPKDYLHKNEIRNYYVDLLKKMNKSHELQ